MAQKWVSFEEVKSQVSMKDVLAHYALMQGTVEKPSKHGLELRLRCPFHDDKTPSLSINAETGKFHCFGCHTKGGDIFDFVVSKEGIAADDRTKSRWPADEGWPEGADKYQLPPGFRKSKVLFNLHRAREHAREGLIVVEGFFTVCEFWQRGRKNVVALMGSSMSAEQERLIVETVGPKGRVLLALDNDEAGRKGSEDARNRLSSQVFVREMAL